MAVKPIYEQRMKDYQCDDTSVDLARQVSKLTEKVTELEAALAQGEKISDLAGNDLGELNRPVIIVVE